MSESQVVHKLGQLLASTYTLTLKTQNFHWNVTGPFFQALHLMFEQQYNALALANDEIAERIRTLGAPAPATYREFSELSFISEPEGKLSAQAMVEMLMNDYDTLIRFEKKLMERADENGDEGTLDLLSTRISEQEKTVWMLRSFLDE